MRLRCQCGKILRVPSESWGKKAKCPSCGVKLRIPERQAEGDKAEALVHETDSREVVAATDDEPSVDDILDRASQRSRKADEDEDEDDDGDYKGRIVVAESNESHRESARKMFVDRGYKVFVAHDGELALEKIRKYKPDVAIVDLKTEKLSGFQVVKTITDQFNPLNKEVWQTPILMTTAKITGRDKQYAISLGVTHYYVKPLVPAKICARIEKILGRLPSGTRRP